MLLAVEVYTLIADRKQQHPLLMGESMKCLSVTPEWAEAMFSLGKDVENRSRRILYRGPLAIHASRRFDREIALSMGLDPSSLVRQAIIGTVEVVGCVRNSDSSWAMPGLWHWLIVNPERLAQPIPCKGSLALFDVDVVRAAPSVIRPSLF